MLRPTMMAIILRTRAMIGTPDPARVTLTDEDVQTALDQHRSDINLCPLRPHETVAEGGKVYYYTFYAPFEDWEGGVKLQTSSTWSMLTPTEEDLQIGRWVFADNQLSPVFITGRTYDRYAAAADLCERMAATMLTTFDFSAGNGSFSRSQVRQNYLEQAKLYRSQARPRLVQQYRGDVNVDGSFGGY